MNEPAPQYNSIIASLTEFQRWAAEQQRAQQAYQLAATNETVKRLSDLASGVLFGNTTSQLQNSSSLTDQVLGHVLPTVAAFGANLLGVSPASMIQAAQTAGAQGGFHLTDSNGQGSVPVYGGQAALRLGDSINGAINSRFMSGGALNLDTTYGASREDIAAVTQDLTRRGAFAGQGGTYETLTPGRLAQLQGQATGNAELERALSGLSAGDQYVSPDAGLGTRTADTIQSALRSVSQLRELLGNYKPQELFAEMERLTGLNFDPSRAGSSLSAGVTALQMRVAHGASAGLDARTTLELGAASASTMDAVMAARTGTAPGSYYGATAQLAGVSNQYALAAWREQNLNGGSRTLSEVMATTAGDMGRILTETPELIEASLGATRVREGPGRDALLASIDAFGSAGTVSERMAARRNMASVYQDVTGLRPGAMIGAYGADTLLEQVRLQDPSIYERLGAAGMRSNQASMIGDFQQITGMFAEDSPYRNLGGTNTSARYAMEMFQTIGGANMRELQSRLQSGNFASATEFAAGFDLPTFGNAGTALQAAEQRIRAASGGGVGVASYMADIQNSAMTSPRLNPMVTGGAIQDSNAFSAEYLRQMNSGRGAPMSIASQIEQGLLGDDAVSALESQQLINFAKNRTGGAGDLTQFRVNDKGGMTFADDAAAKSFAEIMAGTKIGGLNGVDLYKEFGATNEYELRAALEKPENAAKVHAWSKQGGVVMGSDDQGNIDVLKDPSKIQGAYNAEMDKTFGKDRTQSSSPVTVQLNVPGGGAFALLGKIFGLR